MGWVTKMRPHRVGGGKTLATSGSSTRGQEQVQSSRAERESSRPLSRKYNLVLYMCCVYIITYLAWNFSTEPHHLVEEHHHLKKQLQGFVVPSLAVSGRSHLDRRTEDVERFFEDSKDPHAGGHTGKHSTKKRKSHGGKPKYDGELSNEAGMESTTSDLHSSDEENLVSTPTTPTPIPAQSHMNANMKAGDQEAEREDHWQRDGGAEEMGEKKEKDSSSHKTKGHKHKRKHHDVHIAMSKQSIPHKGNKLYTPWKDIRTKRCCRHLGIVSEKLLNVLPDRDLLNETHYGSCAIVGSAGLLLTQEFGREIDEHEAIFRFNIAPAKGFEKHVGSRTTLRLINRNHLGFREFKDEICLFHTTVEEALRRYIRIAQNHPNLPNVPMDMSFYKKVIQWNKLETPTNGYFGLKLALMLCDRIDIYGFLRTWKGYVKYHYFNDEEPNSRQLSRDTKGEMPIILDLLKTHEDKIHFKHPCIVDQLCEGCPAGSHCDGKTPFPVPQPGYCQVEGKQCFLKCDSDSIKCHGAKRFCSLTGPTLDHCPE